MKTKLYDTSLILNGAYRLSLKQGIGKLTARGLAKELGISTQPIYVAFKNMEALRAAVLEEIFQKLIKQYFRRNRNLVEFLDAYYRFAREYTELYLSLSLDRDTRRQTEALFYELFLECLEEKNQLTPDEAKFLFIRIRGMIAGLIDAKEFFTDQQAINQLLYRTILADLDVLLEENQAMA
ncbi:hypothetical protein IGI37_003211 [Enterococcus sp. AZ194]|uniref:TetR/AcrR family transcriptional regulator n=1 Tax=Enterococcus sp. AZ194 TaxID=2774629 RepID=UPI003F1E77F9